MTHTLTHTGKRAGGNNGYKSAGDLILLEQKGPESVENQRLECRQLVGKDEVTSSNLVISSISLAFCRAFFVFWGGFCIYKQNALQSRHFPDLIPIFLHLPLP